MGFKLVKEGWVIHGWLFEDIHFVWLEALTIIVNDPLKLNNLINTFLINSNLILYHSFSSNIYEYPEYHQHQ